MTPRMRIICGWATILTVVSMAVGMKLVGAAPNPAASALSIAGNYRQHPFQIELGAVIIVFAGGFGILEIAGISALVREMQIRAARVMTYVVLIGGVSGIIFLLPPAFFWSVAAYRPNVSPEIIQMLDDLANFALDLPYSVSTVTAAVIGIAIISDKSARPVFPRWFGYYSVLDGIAIIPMGFVGLFSQGGFSSNGLWAFTLPSIITLPWYFFAGYYMIRSAKTAADT